MDLQVSRIKFAQAAEGVRTVAQDFAAGAWNVITSDNFLLEVILAHSKTQRRVGFRYRCDNWDDQPPSLALFEPDTMQELPLNKWPQGGWSIGTHPSTQRPFLCLPGIREYHTHSSHLQDSWASYRSRGTYTLPDIVHRVAQRFGDTNG